MFDAYENITGSYLFHTNLACGHSIHLITTNQKGAPTAVKWLLMVSLDSMEWAEASGNLTVIINIENKL